MVLSGIDGVRLERQTVELVSQDDWAAGGWEEEDGDTPEGKVEITWKLFPQAALSRLCTAREKRFFVESDPIAVEKSADPRLALVSA